MLRRWRHSSDVTSKQEPEGMTLGVLPKEGHNTAHAPKDLSKVAFKGSIQIIRMSLSAIVNMMAIARLSQDREVSQPGLDILPSLTQYSSRFN